jgi:hypothetical protein
MRERERERERERATASQACSLRIYFKGYDMMGWDRGS